MHRDDDELSVRVEQASKELNLKLHPCGTKNVMMAACVDIEGSLILILHIIYHLDIILYFSFFTIIITLISHFNVLISSLTFSFRTCGKGW